MTGQMNHQKADPKANALVNQSEMNKADYVPIMIQNPYEEILSNDENWEKQIEKYKVELICQR